ncbi:MAG: alpha/beta hydrolase [Tepidisphaeraceae bacterium]|jgi:acetyl esterase/lipase
MKISLLYAAFFTLAACGCQCRVDAPPMRLWDHDAPGALGSADQDIPTLTLYRPSAGKASGAAIIVCPGGAYEHLSMREGPPAAQWLGSMGITSFVLKYRISPRYHYPAAVQDVQRAIRLVRSRASQWNVDPNRIGVLGFSAGGHVASSAATSFDAGQPDAPDPVDRISSRPDAVLLVYPVITMVDPYAHARSRKNLLGDHPDLQLEQLASTDLHVTAQTPPCFLVHTADDRTVPVENSLQFFQACRVKKVPAELHIFQHGKHGFALAEDDPQLSQWTTLAAAWLKTHGLVNK